MHICSVKSVSARHIVNTVIKKLRAVFKTPEIITQTSREARVLEQESLAQCCNEISDIHREVSAIRGTDDS